MTYRSEFAGPRVDIMVKKNTLTIIGVVAGVFILIIAGVIGIPKIVDSFTGSGGGGGGDNETTDTPNKPPTAVLTASTEFAREGDVVQFDGNGSFDIDYVGNGSGIVNFIWNWGDGSDTDKGDLGIINHTFMEQGIYTVTLTVIDEDNAQDNASVTITIVPLDVIISSGNRPLIGESLLPGVRIIANTTETNWTVKKNAQYMELNISITGFYAQEVSTNKVEVVLYNPYEKVMANETIEAMGTRSVSWDFEAKDITVAGEYYVFIHCIKGAALVSVDGLVSYIEQ